MVMPIVAKRWFDKHESSTVAWLDLGPHVNPCISLLLRTNDSGDASSRIAVGVMDLPQYRKGPMASERLVPFRIFASHDFDRKSTSVPSGLLRGSGRVSTLGFSGRKLLSFTPTASTSSTSIDSCVLSVGHPVASLPPGLSSTGDMLLQDTSNDKDGILHIYTTIQCERRKGDSNGSLYEWARPLRRHWLCRTVIGDTKETAKEEAKSEDDFGGNDQVTSGAVSDVICSIYHESLSSLVPFRIVRCPGRSICAVLFRPALASKTDSEGVTTLDAVSVAIVDFSGSEASVEMIEGRDVAFLPEQTGSDPTGLVLSRDGTSLTFFTWNASASKCDLAEAYRPIVGVDTETEFVDCRRVTASCGATSVALVVVGRRVRDGRECVLTGELCEAVEMKPDSWSKLLPNMATGRSIWMDPEEETFSLVGLEGDDSGYRNFAVATSKRVVILSSGMTVSAETNVVVSSPSLAPLGSFAVGYISRDKVRYLCCLDRELSEGQITTLPLPSVGYSQTLLLAVRPDRQVLLNCHSGVRLVEYGQNPDTFLLPTATTKPALLLEPMLANAVCVGGKSNETHPILRGVVEKFGRKVATITHAENEGIGRFGAGITPRVFEILKYYGITQAASWLLTGTVPFDRSANTTILPTWLPMASKLMGCSNSDGFLHVVSSGDRYFSDYIKQPDNMPATLPRQSDPSAYVSREYATAALGRGNMLGALKGLDIAGAEVSDSTILQLVLTLESSQGHNATNILKMLGGFDGGGFGRTSGAVKATSSLAALAVTLKQTRGTQEMTEAQLDRWIKPLAPSLQRGARTRRSRLRILGEEDLSTVAGKENVEKDSMWLIPCNESKHVWYVSRLLGQSLSTRPHLFLFAQE